jgi:nicotinamidase-related amidase
MATSSLKTALLVIDMQNIFLPMTTLCLPNIIKLSNHFTQKGWPQYFTQHGHPESDFDEPITNQLVKKWGADGSIHKNTPDWELMPEVSKLVKESGGPVIPKDTYDAFVDTDLEERFRNDCVERVVIVGVRTELCCDTTGRSAFNRGWETWMVSNATGSVDYVQHEEGFKAWGYGYGDVLATEEVLRRLG